MAIEQKTIELPADHAAKLTLKQQYQQAGWRIVAMTADFIVVERETPATEAAKSSGRKKLLD